jgi:hypothetical protein
MRAIAPSIVLSMVFTSFDVLVELFGFASYFSPD